METFQRRRDGFILDINEVGFGCYDAFWLSLSSLHFWTWRRVTHGCRVLGWCHLEECERLPRGWTYTVRKQKRTGQQNFVWRLRVQSTFSPCKLPPSPKFGSRLLRQVIILHGTLWGGGSSVTCHIVSWLTLLLFPPSFLFSWPWTIHKMSSVKD